MCVYRYMVGSNGSLILSYLIASVVREEGLAIKFEGLVGRLLYVAFQ